MEGNPLVPFFHSSAALILKKEHTEEQPITMPRVYLCHAYSIGFLGVDGTGINSCPPPTRKISPSSGESLSSKKRVNHKN